MTRAPALPFSTKYPDALIDAAVLRLVDLFARQAARKLAVDAPDVKETTYAANDPQKD